MEYNKSPDQVYSDVNTSSNGLTSADAKSRLEKNGYNELSEKKKGSLIKLIIEQFRDPLIIILLIAAAVQIFLGEIIESVIILVVVILNAVLGVTQTKKAEGSLQSLKKMSSPNAKVLRDGQKITISAREVVVGDIVFLEAGDYVPADGRLIEVQSIKAVEGMLTGESEPVLKDITTIDGEAPLGDQLNMVFSGSMIVYGRGTYVVTRTGMNTEMGKIASLLESAESKMTPLQIKLEEFSKKLGMIILVLCVLIFVTQSARGYFSGDVALGKVFVGSFMFSVSVAVAAIPEALSSIVTIVLAVGTNIMARKQAIIRKLPAVETLGSTSVICTDKTGTLTQNKMTVVDQYLYGLEDPKLDVEMEGADRQENLFILANALCNDAEINEEGNEIGDPTEVGLIAYINKTNRHYQDVRNEFPRVGEIPFDSDRKLMTTVNKIGSQTIMFCKGAPDVIFGRCTSCLNGQEQLPLTEEVKNEYRHKNEEFSNKALRVLAFAMKKVPDGFQPTLEDENDLTLIGLTAMIDPPRKEVYHAVETAKHAGIRSIMITGDHKTTAAAIGKEIGLMAEGDMALTGQELDKISDDQLDADLEHISVYARVSPENKIRIVKAWQRKHKITAMTGDGVNDAPALKQADIGIGMGSGTEVAKDAASLILVDDNFSTIISAVEVGRTVYSNIKKSITYLFAGNLGAIIAILFAVFANWPNPFTPVQLLFINLVNDSLPAIALGLEPPEKNIMEHKPRDPNESILAGGTLRVVLIRGILIGIAVIFAQYIGMKVSAENGAAMAFSTIIIIRILQTLPARSNTFTVFHLGFFTNKYVLGAIGITFVMYLFTLIPFIRPFFEIPADFSWKYVGLAIIVGIIVIVIMELLKMINKKEEA